MKAISRHKRVKEGALCRCEKLDGEIAASQNQPAGCVCMGTNFRLIYDFFIFYCQAVFLPLWELMG